MVIIRACTSFMVHFRMVTLSVASPLCGNRQDQLELSPFFLFV